MVNKQTLLSFFREKTKKPLSFKDMVNLMGLSPSEARALKKVLRRMLHDGDIVLTRKGLYVPVSDVDLMTGYFEAHKEGYGFVIIEKPGERDIFIPARATSGAMDNDRVVVRIENRQKRDGTIIRILERAHVKIAGRLEIENAVSYVRPKNKSIAFDLYVSPNDRGGARNGDTVVAEILNYPADRKPPSGRIVKIIEKPEDPASEVEAIIDEFSIPRRFPKNVAEEAKMLSVKGMSEAAEEKRKDLRELPTVTIDGEHAKDFDDAVSIKLTEHGYKLWVHIADVGYYVPWDSAIDIEARKRGTSTYFPDRVIPMLPNELSEDLCSLRPEVERLAFTAEMDFGRHGEKLNAKFYSSLIKSNERMTYTSVRKILIDNDKHERKRYDYLLSDFELMAELCGVLRKKRLERGSLDFDLPEPEVLLDMQGRPEAIVRAERNFAHIIIEEFMVAANEAVAEYLAELETPTLYRIHEEPDTQKMEGMLRYIKPLRGTVHGARYEPKNFSALLREVKGRPEEEMVNYMVLRSLKQARYSPLNAGHFGLASGHYTHFTSPIRRYPDLVVHRILREVLHKKCISEKRKQELEALLPDIAFNSSRTERLSGEAENAVLNAMRVWFMKDKVGDELEGRVVNVTPYGLKIRLKDFYVEGFLHVSYMTDDFYEFNERAMTLYGKNKKLSYTIGKELKVKVDRVDMEERSIIFGV
ncbi:MAG: ribonuclease R [Nitrospirae bacterium GWF2_44_13]|nr:MAG: ribonuclease R [Nitrospirae bacterium GWF2_44_13]OGW66458.1 MAG: ribonuclease R [Nitrospirae bacterium RIFOXYA2_FULL_44_9]HBG92254.1 ribonuclease R [Nitrospiraceae bacterium]